MSSLHTLIDRIRAEFTDLPGLKLTSAQACRLWQVDERQCRTALATLIKEGFLSQTPSGVFVALPRPQGKSAKAVRSDTVRPNRCPHCHHLNSAPVEHTVTTRQASISFRCAACSRVVSIAQVSA
jgi:hypothetical protein